MKALLWSFVVSIFIIGCGDSSSTSYEENSRCSDSLTTDNISTSYEINTSGSIAMNCMNKEFTIGGTDSLSITNRSFEITSKTTFEDGSSWQGSEKLNESEGSYSMSGSHTQLGDYECTVAYTSTLPTTISNDNPDGIQSVIFDVDYSTEASIDSTLVGQVCPDWVDDGTLDNNVKSSETLAHYKLTDSSAKAHTITQNTNMTQNIAYLAVVEHELVADTSLRIHPENIVVLHLEHADEAVDTNDTDAAGTDCYTYLHDKKNSVTLHVDANSSTKSMHITNKTTGLYVETSAGENNTTYEFTANEEHEVCITHDGVSEGQTLFVRMESIQQQDSPLRYNIASAARLVAFRSCDGCNLSNANLKNTRLKGASIKGADLNGANLSGADLEKADLGCGTFYIYSFAHAPRPYTDCTYLNGATLIGTNLKNAVLERAELQHTDLRDADLSNTDCSVVNFSGADMRNTTYVGADFSGARWWNGTVCEDNSIGTCR